MTIIIMIIDKSGMPTAIKMVGPANDNAKTEPGMNTKVISIYNIENHRYLAVVLPSNFARPIGAFLVNGIG